MVKHFTSAEFTRSDVATRLGIDNSLPPDLEPQAWATLEMLERIRAHLCKLAGRDVAINISSGYRSPAVNLAVGNYETNE